MKPNNQTYEAAMKLMAPEMRPFLEWLEAERVETLELMSTARPEIVQVLQGQVQALKRILDTIKSSRDVLEKSSKG